MSNTIVDALKDLYVAMGGTASDNDSKAIAQAVEALTSVAGGGGGGSSIPVASADTLGGVKVGDGLSITEQGVLSASGGGGALVLHETLTTEGEGQEAVVIHTLDKTAGEIVEATEAGVPVMLYYVNDETGAYCAIWTLAEYSYGFDGPGDDSDYVYTFAFFSPAHAALNQNQITLFEFNAIAASLEAAAAAYPLYVESAIA